MEDWLAGESVVVARLVLTAARLSGSVLAASSTAASPSPSPFPSLFPSSFPSPFPSPFFPASAALPLEPLLASARARSFAVSLVGALSGRLSPSSRSGRPLRRRLPALAEAAAEGTMHFPPWPKSRRQPSTPLGWSPQRQPTEEAGGGGSRGFAFAAGECGSSRFGFAAGGSRGFGFGEGAGGFATEAAGGGGSEASGSGFSTGATGGALAWCTA
mmetsp:Transcript_28544/g.91423  ORF Transcript_28544/g.91423 Transcript_28544/m.91423 type:complete len:215 (+) Transcript_28544:494-1138(+)